MIPAVAVSAAVALAVVLQGCASILGDSRYPVAVSSMPNNVSFEIADKSGRVIHTGTTPGTVVLKSGKSYFSGQTYTLRFKKEGFADQTVILDSGVSGWYWGNILFGGVIGMLIVDPLTGAMYTLEDSVNANMGAPLAASGEPGLTIVMIDSLSESQREALVPLS